MGLCSFGCCSGMSSLLWRNDWMYICSYGSKRIGVLICFHMNKCTFSRYTILLNLSPNNIRTNTIPCLTSFIQILHVITHLTPNPQFHAFHPVLSQPVQGTATYRVRNFNNSQIAFSVDSTINIK